VRFGVHIRLDKGLLRSLDYAEALECEAAQLFSGNPSGWARKPLAPDSAEEFRARAAGLGVRPVILHTPYLVNLAAPDDTVWRKSTEALADAVSRAPALGASVVVTHIGSHKGTGYEAGVRRIAEAVRHALGAAEGPRVALELGSGSGNSIGSTFAEVSDILDALEADASRVGVCIDTAHLWGAGYDISTSDGVLRLFDEMQQTVGVSQLLLAHLNDTQMELGSRRDRHYHIGQGRIGLEGFRAIVNYPRLDDVPGIIETPGHERALDHMNLATLRSLRITL